MSDLGNRISELRKAKMLSQESLAESAGISLRTLQRIEKENTSPLGDTVNRLATALNVTLDELLEFSLVEDFNYIRSMHFSVLIVAFLPLGNIILPAIFWLRKKNRIKYLSSYAKRLLNFQITWTILLFFPLFLIATIWRSQIAEIYSIAIIYPVVMVALNWIYLLIVGLSIKGGDKNYFPIAIKFII